MRRFRLEKRFNRGGLVRRKWNFGLFWSGPLSNRLSLRAVMRTHFLMRPPLGVPEWLRGCLLGPFKSADSRAPAGRFSRMLYAHRYLNAASLRRELCALFDLVYQHKARTREQMNRNHRTYRTTKTNATQQFRLTKPQHTKNDPNQHRTRTNEKGKRNLLLFNRAQPF